MTGAQGRAAGRAAGQDPEDDAVAPDIVMPERAGDVQGRNAEQRVREPLMDLSPAWKMLRFEATPKFTWKRP